MRRLMQGAVVFIILVLLALLIICSKTDHMAPYEGLGRSYSSQWYTWKGNQLYFSDVVDGKEYKEYRGLYCMDMNHAKTDQSITLLSPNYAGWVNLYQDDIYFINTNHKISRILRKSGQEEVFSDMENFSVDRLLIIGDWMYWTEYEKDFMVKAYCLDGTKEQKVLKTDMDKGYQELFAYNGSVGFLIKEGRVFRTWNPENGNVTEYKWQDPDAQEEDTLYGFIENKFPVYYSGGDIYISKDFERSGERKVCSLSEITGTYREQYQVLIHKDEILITVINHEQDIAVFENYIYSLKRNTLDRTADSYNPPQEWNDTYITGGHQEIYDDAELVDRKSGEHIFAGPRIEEGYEHILEPSGV